MHSIIRSPYFVPESKRTDELFKELQRTKVHMAIVIDEYGGTEGIVTIEDLIEAIVGKIYDEHDDDEFEVEQLSEDDYLINGMLSLREMKDLLQIELPIDDYDTLSGFIIGQLGRIPEEQEEPYIIFNGYRFKVEQISELKINKVRVSKVRI